MAYPVLIYKSEEKLFVVHVESCVINDRMDFLERLATLLSTYRIFNLNFPKPCRKTLSYIGTVLLKLPDVSLPQC